ncbi:MAG: type II toxin-antitoxin system Phd/YefM family antitoxin [Caldilineaceae bacterium]|nr:type II toxin-antitoxin system Phd/YefM family antitoxin [Caldilineaceae bacterium]
MAETTISMTELRQHLGEYVNRVAYGDERLVLLSHGQPKVVILSYEELQRLESNQATDQETTRMKMLSDLALANQLREEHAEYLASHGIEIEDSSETLRQLREGLIP